MEGKVEGKTKSFRVDVEPDSSKIQIQSGKIDIRIRLSEITAEDKTIIDQIEKNPYGAKFNQNSMDKLVKGVRKALERLK